MLKIFHLITCVVLLAWANQIQAAEDLELHPIQTWISPQSAEADARVDTETSPASDPTSSPEEILHELFTLAEADDAQACVLIGQLFEQGNILTRNYGDALYWYRKAALLDSAVGSYNAGICFEVGMGTAPDPMAALAYYERAAALGLDQAMYKCAYYYLEAKTGVRDNQRAIAYLERAAQAGHATAANDLGLIYAQGLLDQTRDERKAVNMFILGADLGNPEAMKNIGVSFHQGIGRTPDQVKALKWFIIANHYEYPASDLALELSQAMSESQIQTAQIEAREWINNHEAGLPNP